MSAVPSPAPDPRPGTPCPYCREVVAAGTEICPHCDERISARPDAPGNGAVRRVHRLRFLADALVGLALGVFLIGLARRLAAGPLPDLASSAASLRFLEMAAAASFLLLVSLALSRRSS